MLGSSACSLPHAELLHDLLYNPEDGGDMFVQNVCLVSPEYTTLHLREIQLFLI
jgi:hypothetical protein